jgi:L-fucose mutarotase
LKVSFASNGEGDRVKECHAVVSTSEPCLYANLIIRKGVIYPSKME